LVKIRYREGLAIHHDSVSCAGVRKGTGAAVDKGRYKLGIKKP